MKTTKAIALGLGTLLLTSSCIGPTSLESVNQASPSNHNGLQNNGNNGSNNPVNDPTANAFTLSAAAPQSVNLGAKQSLQLTLKAGSAYTGMVNLSLDAPELRDIDPASLVAVNISPMQVNLIPGMSVPINIDIITDTQAPTITDSHFHINAIDAVASPQKGASSEVPLNVNAVYEVNLNGGAAPEEWSSPKTPLNFAPHMEGLTIHFNNLDNASAHIVHGNGAIPHQNTAMPLVKAVSGVVQAGGIYTVKIAFSAKSSSGSYYCHTHENNGNARVMNFNMAPAVARLNVPAAPGSSDAIKTSSASAEFSPAAELATFAKSE